MDKKNLFLLTNPKDLKTDLLKALEAGYTPAEVADVITGIMNEVQREYDKLSANKERDEAAKALASALTMFCQAYTGEKIPISVDNVKMMGEGLLDFLGSGDPMALFDKAECPEKGSLYKDCESFWRS